MSFRHLHLTRRLGTRNALEPADIYVTLEMDVLLC